jgi:fatty acid desaturase
MFFYGNIFGLDYIHHVKVHHAEDGGPDDPQNSYGYDRTSTWDFLHYVGVRHLAVTLGFATPRWLRQHNRVQDARFFTGSVIVFYAFVAGLLWFNWRLALAVAIGPLLLSNVFAALASWLQHCFESRNIDDPIANTITLLSPTEYLNEGYHLAHHYRSGTHWTELPQRFEEWRARHPGAQPIVLEGVDWVDLAVLLYVRRRLDLVAERWISSGDASLTLETRTALLRQRLGGG